jgi:type IX secretion system PorP/SprF family membrane protein
MNKIFHIILCILIFQISNAQQDLFHTMYIHSPSLQNPAYAGMAECLSITALHRNQWFSTVDGAPKSIFINANSPINKGNVNLGATILSDKLGIVTNNIVALDYAYKMKLNKKLKLSVGLKPSLTLYKVNYTDLNIKDEDDLVFKENKNIWLPNIGAGIYLNSSTYFIGFAIPYIYQNELRKENIPNANEYEFGKQYRHYVLNTGYLININSFQKLRLSAQYKMSKSSKQLDLTSILYIKQDKVNLGVNYRTNDSFGLLCGLKFDNGLRTALAFDITTQKTKKQINNALEIMIGYEFSYNTSKVIHPRYF